MSEEELAEQATLAETFTEAIAAIEAQLTVTEEAVSIAADATFEEQDAEAVQQLLDCLSEINKHIASGELAVADVGFGTAEQTDEKAHA